MKDFPGPEQLQEMEKRTKDTHQLLNKAGEAVSKAKRILYGLCGHAGSQCKQWDFCMEDVDQGVVSVVHNEYTINQVQGAIASLESVGFQVHCAIEATELDQAMAQSLRWVPEVLVKHPPPPQSVQAAQGDPAVVQHPQLTSPPPHST